jgi:hypothetical protein
MTEPTCAQSIAWLGLRLAVPTDWEVVRHSLSLRKGGLTLVDRRRQRLQLRWTACRKPPLLDRMLDDHRARQLKDEPDALIEPYHHGPWRGLVRELDDQTWLTRAAWYEPNERVLLEAVVSHGDGELEMRDALIDGIDLAEPMREATTWRVFGLAAQTPERFRAYASSVNAGEVSLSFAEYDAPGGEKLRPGRATLTRLGMADGWFAGDLGKYLQAREPKLRFVINERILDEAFTGGARATAVTARCIEPGPRIKRLAGRLRTRRDLLWHDASVNAVFHIRTLSFDKAPIEPTAFRLGPAKEVA